MIALLSVALLASTPTAPAAPPLLKRASQVLDSGLNHADPKVRAEALAALGLSARADAKPILLQSLKDENGALRFSAAQGLRSLADPKTADAIVEAYTREKGWAVRKELVHAAAATGAKKMVPDLKLALDEKQEDLRLAAAWALKDLGDPAGDAALKKLGNPERKGGKKEGVDRWARKVLSGEKEGDPVLAVRTLAEWGGTGDLPLLEKRLDAEDAATRLFAAAGILRLGR